MEEDYKKLDIINMSILKRHPIPISSRIPHLRMFMKKLNARKSILGKISMKRKNGIIYETIQNREENDDSRHSENYYYLTLCICFSFILGLAIGFAITISQDVKINNSHQQKDHIRNANTFNIKSAKTIEKEAKPTVSHTTFINRNNRYESTKSSMKDSYPKSITENMKNILKDKENTKYVYGTVKTKHVPSKTTVLYDNIYWGPMIEDSLPKGYDKNSASIWEKYVEQSEIVKMEPGCGRMQNRLVTFSDGVQACVRYRHNNDQIQGEIFSFYLGRHLGLENFAPSVLRIVDVKKKLWIHVANDIVEANWILNKAVVLTQFIPDLNPAMIPSRYRQDDRHLNKYDVKLMTKSIERTESIIIEKLKKQRDSIENFSYIDIAVNRNFLEKLVELAQWSDLIIFDFLTANLDRIVNNLFNHQWNINIMEAPAHNLAKKIDNGLLMFLDNESSLLHGYRLLTKYDVYHNLMLDNLCVFRKSTIDILKKTYVDFNIGILLNDLFMEKNDALVRDNLPQFPAKNAKILHQRIGKVLNKVKECEKKYSFG